MKAIDSSFLPSLVGLAFLLLIIVAAVPSATFNDVPRTPEKVRAYLAEHEHVIYFIQGKDLAKKVFNSPSARWAQDGVVAVDRTVSAHDQIWVAGGTVTVPGNGGMSAKIPWEVIFAPDTDNALYTRVGEMESGDRARAQKAAGTLFPERVEGP